MRPKREKKEKKVKKVKKTKKTKKNEIINPPKIQKEKKLFFLQDSMIAIL